MSISINEKYFHYPYRVTENSKYFNIEKHIDFSLFKKWLPIKFYLK